LESSHQRVIRKRKRSLKQIPVVSHSADLPASLPNIEELIAFGDITLGRLRPIGCVATAADEDRCLAMLVRRRGETLGGFLTRLECPRKFFVDTSTSRLVNTVQTRRLRF
jgi:hypothetical protein